jgi:NADH-quinone oxidoreductase subunit L
VFAGYVFYPYFVGHEHLEFWGKAIFVREGHDILEMAHHVPEWVPTLPLIVAISGVVLAYLAYVWMPGIPALAARVFKPIHMLFYNKWYVDEIYDALFVKQAWRLGRGFFKVGDQAIINGLGPDGLASVSRKSARVLSILQTGYLYHYAFTMIVAIVLLMGWLLLKLMGVL